MQTYFYAKLCDTYCDYLGDKWLVSNGPELSRNEQLDDREQLMTTIGQPWESVVRALNAEVSIVLHMKVVNNMWYYLFTACPGRLAPSFVPERSVI